MEARASRHCGRKGNARHNDRDFDTSKANHIDETKTSQNFYQHCYQDTEPELSFEQAEKKYYQEHYSQALQKQNERYIQQRHTERVKTIDDLYKSKNKQPCENILQIGNKDNHCAGVTPDLLMQIYNGYREKFDAWNSEHGNHVHVLSVAMHCDETSPHLHERIVFDYMTDEGLKLEQKKALEMAGVPLPDPTKKDSRYNNRKMTFDKEMRGLWIETCKEFGIDIIEEPLPTHRHKAKEEYIDEQIQNKIVYNDTLQKEIEEGEIAKKQVSPYIVAKDFEPDTKKIFGKNLISDRDLYSLRLSASLGKDVEHALDKLHKSEEIINKKKAILREARHTNDEAQKIKNEAQQIKDDAVQEAKQIISKAKQEAQQLKDTARQKAEEEIDDLLNEIHDNRQEAMEYEAEAEQSYNRLKQIVHDRNVIDFMSEFIQTVKRDFAQLYDKVVDAMEYDYNIGNFDDITETADRISEKDISEMSIDEAYPKKPSNEYEYEKE